MLIKSNKKERRKRKKRTARVVCPDRREFWTTQSQFWQWIRDQVIIKTQDHPLTGTFRHGHEGSLIILSNTILNMKNRNHIVEAMHSRCLRKSK